MIQTLFLALALAPGAGVTVNLPAEAQVAGVEFSLGDIASVESDDEAASQRVRALHLGYAPAPGYTRLIEGRSLVREVSASFPGIEVTVSGAEACRVSPSVQHIEAAAIVALAKAELIQVFRGHDAELQMQGRLQDLEVPLGDAPAELQVRLRERSARPGSWSVPVDVLVDGGVIRTIWTSWTADLWQERDVLVRDIPRGGSLTPADLVLQRVRVQQRDPGPLVEKSALRGALARRDLRAGELVRLSDIEREIVIRRGDSVHVEVKKGAITARGAGTAQEDARIGDSVKVVMSSSGAEVIAVASGRERVEIRMN